MRQLHLFAPLPETSPGEAAPERPRREVRRPAAGGLARRLAALLRGDLSSLTLTNNRSRIVSARQVKGGLEVRIHRSFVHAPPATLKKVAEFLDGARGSRRRRALAAIREHFDNHRQAEPAAAAAGRAASRRPRRRLAVEPVGRCFDLRQIRDDLNRRFFGARLEVEISWGRNSPLRRRRRRACGFSLRLGSYLAEDRLVRIHRALDRPDVPRFVVESVVYHEMLHAAIPPVVRPGQRRQIHPPEFRRREREFPHYQAAEDWLAENLARLAGVG